VKVAAKRIVDVYQVEARALATTVRAPVLEAPREASPGARFGYGAGLPIALLRALWADPALRRYYLRVKLVQLSAVIVGTIAFAFLFGIGESLEGKHGAVEVKMSTHGAAAIASSFYAVVAGLEWTVTALSRQYDDQISRAVALLTRTPPEDPDLKPEVHIDVPWMWRKAKRRLRGMRVFFSAAPLLALPLQIPRVGPWLNGALTFAWGLYWTMTFTASKSRTAWNEEGTAADPWFLRRASAFVERYAILRWWLPRLYVRLWRRLTQAVASPCACVERAPLQLLGLATSRGMIGVPGVYLFLRPLYPVAAARINLANAPDEPALLTSADSSAIASPDPSLPLSLEPSPPASTEPSPTTGSPPETPSRAD
jgi:hypothetical protein